MDNRELNTLKIASGFSTGELAERLGMKPRTLRNILAGKESIGTHLAERIAKVFSDADGQNPCLPKDHWIIGEGPPPHRREYIIHTCTPKFIGRIVAVDSDGLPIDSGDVADLLTGVTHAFDDCIICECVWCDPRPKDLDSLTALLNHAAEAIRKDAQ